MNRLFEGVQRRGIQSTWPVRVNRVDNDGMALAGEAVTEYSFVVENQYIEVYRIADGKSQKAHRETINPAPADPRHKLGE